MKVKEPEKKKPAEMFVGGNNSIKSQWRHQPILLITGVVKYSAIVSNRGLNFFYLKIADFIVFGINKHS